MFKITIAVLNLPQPEKNKPYESYETVYEQTVEELDVKQISGVVNGLLDTTPKRLY